MSNKIVIIFISGILLFNFGIIFTNASEDNSIKSNYPPTDIINPVLSQYIVHEPIQISSLADANILGIPGSGTEEDPFIIEGLYISGNETTFRLIEIKAWTYLPPHFIVRDNYLYGNGSDGIYFEQIKNGSIYNNVIEFTGTGIDIVQDGADSPSNELIIVNNTISNSYNTGIHASQVHYTKILNNNIMNSGSGITLRGNSINTVIANNLINNMTNMGIKGVQWHGYEGLTAMGFNLTISGNFINNASDGILWQYDQSLITNNTIINSRKNGIKLSQFVIIWSEGTNVLTDSEGNNIVSNNLIIDAYLNGISIEGANFNIFRENDIKKSVNYGIFITGMSQSNLVKRSNNNLFEHNKISNSNGYGIKVSYLSNSNSIISNFFSKNNVGNFQVFDEGGTSEFRFNYWDDWLELDNDQDGIVDEAYDFLYNSDLFPRVNPDIYLELIIPVQTIGNDGIITITEIDTITPVHTEIIPRSYDGISFTLFVVFSIIGIMTIQGKNPVFNKILEKLRRNRKEASNSINSSSTTQIRKTNLNIYCTACGTTNPPLSLFCMECGISQES